MRMPRFTWPRAILVGVPLGLLSFVATRAWIGEAAEPGPPVQGWSVDLEGEEAEQARAEIAAGVPDRSISIRRAQWTGFDVQARGRSVLVAGSAAVYEGEPDVRYVWTVRATADDDRGLLFEQHYPREAITPAAGEEIAPEFADTIELPPGRYNVELILHVVEPGQDLGRLPRGDDGKALGLTRLRQARRVVVPG